MSEITFQGPAGRLEAKFFENKENPKAPIAIVLHPHPQHGGTMNNKVTYKLYESFAKAGFSVLRFNYRGVCHSEGKYDNGDGELFDAAAALDWIHNNKPQASSIWISGFSFGAWVAMRLLMRRPDVDNFIAIAPPIGNDDYDFSSFNLCPANGLIVSAENDGISDPANVEDFIKTLSRIDDVKVHYSKVAGAEHLFPHHLEELSKTVDQYISFSLNK